MIALIKKCEQYRANSTHPGREDHAVFASLHLSQKLFQLPEAWVSGARIEKGLMLSRVLLLRSSRREFDGLIDRICQRSVPRLERDPRRMIDDGT